MKQRKRNVQGFTLVELIVVIAIIGVLAGILVPTMMGFIKKAKFASANGGAKAVLNAGMTACRETDVLKPIPDGIYTMNSGPSGDTTSTASTIRSYMYQYNPQLQSRTWAMMIKDDVVVGACYAENDTTSVVGTYPTPNDESRDISGGYSEALNYAENGTWTQP